MLFLWDNEQENEEDEQKDDEIYFDGEVAEIDDVKIEIKEIKVIPAGEEGNEHEDSPVFAIWYDATNKTDKEIDPGMA